MQPRVKLKNNLLHTLSKAGILHSGFFIPFYFPSDARFLYIPYQSLKASKDCREGFKIVFGENISFRSWIAEVQVFQFSPVSKKSLLQDTSISDIFQKSTHSKKLLRFLSPQRRPYFRNYRMGKGKGGKTMTDVLSPGPS